LQPAQGLSFAVANSVDGVGWVQSRGLQSGGVNENQMVPGTVGGTLETTAESQLSTAGDEGDF
jgi:hypothetical protein